MPAFDWQLAITLLIVAGAVFLLTRRAVRLVRGRNGSGCGAGGCGSCSSNASQSQSQPLVTLEGLPASHEEDGALERRRGERPA